MDQYNTIQDNTIQYTSNVEVREVWVSCSVIIFCHTLILSFIRFINIVDLKITFENTKTKKTTSKRINAKYKINTRSRAKLICLCWLHRLACTSHAHASTGVWTPIRLPIVAYRGYLNFGLAPLYTKTFNWCSIHSNFNTAKTGTKCIRPIDYTLWGWYRKLLSSEWNSHIWSVTLGRNFTEWFSARQRARAERRQTNIKTQKGGWTGGTDIERYVFQSDDPMQTDGFDNI